MFRCGAATILMASLHQEPIMKFYWLVNNRYNHRHRALIAQQYVVNSSADGATVRFAIDCVERNAACGCGGAATLSDSKNRARYRFAFSFFLSSNQKAKMLRCSVAAAAAAEACATTFFARKQNLWSSNWRSVRNIHSPIKAFKAQLSLFSMQPNVNICSAFVPNVYSVTILGRIPSLYVA